jgi:hypothetical protein
LKKPKENSVSLHARRRNSEGIGFILDLPGVKRCVDPVKCGLDV